MTPDQAVPKLSLRIQSSLTGSSITESRNSSRPTLSECLESLTTGCSLSGNFVAALMFMAWPGCLMHQMWRSFSLLLTSSLMQSRRKSPGILMTLSPPAIQPFSQMGATSMMHQLQRQIPISATSCTDFG